MDQTIKYIILKNFISLSDYHEFHILKSKLKDALKCESQALWEIIESADSEKEIINAIVKNVSDVSMDRMRFTEEDTPVTENSVTIPSAKKGNYEATIVQCLKSCVNELDVKDHNQDSLRTALTYLTDRIEALPEQTRITITYRHRLSFWDRMTISSINIPFKVIDEIGNDVKNFLLKGECGDTLRFEPWNEKKLHRSIHLMPEQPAEKVFTP